MRTPSTETLILHLRRSLDRHHGQAEHEEAFLATVCAENCPIHRKHEALEATHLRFPLNSGLVCLNLSQYVAWTNYVTLLFLPSGNIALAVGEAVLQGHLLSAVTKFPIAGWYSCQEGSPLPQTHTHTSFCTHLSHSWRQARHCHDCVRRHCGRINGVAQVTDLLHPPTLNKLCCKSTCSQALRDTYKSIRDAVVIAQVGK
jgi:hypothetical protein